MTDARDDTYTSRQVCLTAAVTYRQLDYWNQIRLLEPSLPNGTKGWGTRNYSAVDVRCAAVLGALSRRFGGGHGSWCDDIGRLIIDAYRARPTAEFIVVLDGRHVVLCDTVEQAVHATHGACVSTIVWPDRIIWPDHQPPEAAGVKVSAESETSPGVPPAAASSRRPAGASAASAP